MSTLVSADPVMPEALDDRAQMNWEFLFAIADLAGGDWPKRARAAAIALTSEREEPSQGKRMLAAFRDLFRAHEEGLTSEQVERFFAADKDSEWAHYKGGHPINKWQIAVLLKPYGIRPGVITLHSKLVRGYKRQQFETAFRHFLPSEKKPPQGRKVVSRSDKKSRK
jgi:hypothetical protein